MNRNVSIVVVILVLVVIAGYLVWLRSKYQPQVTPQIPTGQVIAEPTPSAAASAEEATPPGKEATGSSTKSATSSSVKK